MTIITINTIGFTSGEFQKKVSVIFEPVAARLLLFFASGVSLITLSYCNENFLL